MLMRIGQMGTTPRLPEGEGSRQTAPRFLQLLRQRRYQSYPRRKLPSSLRH